MTTHAHEIDPTVGSGELSEVADGVHAWVQPDGTWWVNNAGAVIGPAAILVVDTCATEARTRRFLSAVAEAGAGRPVRMAVNTHEHGDHTYGNSLLPAETVLIGHENMRARLATDPLIDGCPPFWEPVPDWGAVERRLPDVVTGGDLTVVIGDRRVELLHPGYAAHTTGDLVAWVPEGGVLFSGDLIFNGLTPLVMAGSVEGARRSLDWIAGIGPEVLVPGHGPIVRRHDLDRVLAEHERYYRLVLELAADGRTRGLAPLDVASRAELGEFAAWADGERLVLNLHRAYADADGRPLDLGLALLDAVAWNGGPLTTHVCCSSS